MNNKIDNAEELPLVEIEQVIESQTSRVNRGVAWLIGGILVTLITLNSPIQIVAWGAILYGLSDIINGNSKKSRYERMLPKNLLPAEIECIKCKTSLDLEIEERISQKYFCPECNQTFHYNSESMES